MWTFQAKGLLYYHNRVYFHRECVSLYFLHVCETCTSRLFRHISAELTHTNFYFTDNSLDLFIRESENRAALDSSANLPSIPGVTLVLFGAI